MRYGDLLPATEHLPGSLGKIEVMRQRARNGYSVFHPDDRLDCRGLRGGREADSIRPRSKVKRMKASQNAQ
jgi:hypothetical protein